MKVIWKLAWSHKVQMLWKISEYLWKKCPFFCWTCIGSVLEFPMLFQQKRVKPVGWNVRKYSEYTVKVIEEIMHSPGCSQETSLMANIFFESVTMSCEKYLIFCNSLNVGLHKLTTKLHVYKMTDCSTWKENKLNTEKRVFFPTTLLVMVAPILVVRNLFQTS